MDSKIDGCRSVEGDAKIKQIKPWKSEVPLTRADVDRMRDEFWDTQPEYGGNRGIHITTAALLKLCQYV